jgi:hypothetical protein
MAVGELRPRGLASVVSRRRVPGRVAEDGELKLNELPAPWDNEGFRPLTPVALVASLFSRGGLSGELMSVVNACCES